MRQSSELNWCQQLVRPLFFRGKDQKSNPEYSKVESDNQFVNQLYISFVIVKPEANTSGACKSEKRQRRFGMTTKCKGGSLWQLRANPPPA